MLHEDIKADNILLRAQSMDLVLVDFGLSRQLPPDNPFVSAGQLLPPANEVCEGYVFTRVCLSTGGGGGLQVHTQGEVEGSGWGVGVSRPTPEGWVSRPRLGGGVSQHALRQTPPQQTAIAAGSTHPTGMYSCVICVRCSCTCQILISKQFYMIKLLRPFENTLHLRSCWAPLSMTGKPLSKAPLPCNYSPSPPGSFYRMFGGFPELLQDHVKIKKSYKIKDIP